MSLPKIGTAGIESIGVAVVTKVTARPQADGGLGFIFRPQPSGDVGIDGHIEIIDQATGEATGRIIGVQIKAGPSWFRSRHDGGWLINIKKSTVRYWRQYAVPVILVVVNVKTEAAYWTLVSSGSFAETKEGFKIPIAKVQRFDAGTAATIAALAADPPPWLAVQLRELTAQLSKDTSVELERHRTALREGHLSAARAWAEDVVNTPARFRALDSPVAARVLRFAANVALDAGDVEIAEVRIAEARSLDPDGSDVRMRAALLARRGDVPAALELLRDSPEVAAQQMRASLLLSLGRADEAETVLDTTAPVAPDEIADGLRLRALARLAARDIDGARAAIDRAKGLTPRGVTVRWVSGVITYYGGLVPDALPTRLPPWPQPPRDDSLRRDMPSLAAFSTAADTFRDLLDVDLSLTKRRQMEAWRLAAIVAAPDGKSRAAEFARERLRRDPTNPYILLWAAVEQLGLDLQPNFAALSAELEGTGDLEAASIYATAGLAAGHAEIVLAWLNTWKTRFTAADAEPTWTYLHARTLLASGAVKEARASLASVNENARLPLEAEILSAEVSRSDAKIDTLLAHLEMASERTGDSTFLLEACLAAARSAKWEYVAQHIDAMLERFPTPPVRRLAIFAHFNTTEDARCLTLIEDALARNEPGSDHRELRRMRMQVRSRMGWVQEAVDDLEYLVAKEGMAASVADLLLLAKFRLLLGRTHELAAGARQLRSRTDLGANDALTLAELLAYDDAPMAREFWEMAVARGIHDADVTSAVALGYKLGLDARISDLMSRMAGLAASGSPYVRQYTIDELMSLTEKWRQRDERLLALYARGETPTHAVVPFLNEPLSHLYHVVPEANSKQSSLRQRFALQARDGSRGIPHLDAELAAPGRLALDLSALLLAHHIGILPLIERQFAPVRLHHAVIAALQEQRAELQPHQPSRLELTQRLLDAERHGWIEAWDGELPNIDAAEREASDGWQDWLALLERARREDAFVVDTPLDDGSQGGRPLEVAGPHRLARLIPVHALWRHLQTLGATEAATPPADDPWDTRRAEESEVLAEATAADTAALPQGAVLYLTDTGAEALATAELLGAAAEFFTLRVNPSAQDARRAHLDVLPEFKERAAWLEGLIRRISAGLVDGRYELLPVRSPRHSSARAVTSSTEPVLSELVAPAPPLPTTDTVVVQAYGNSTSAPATQNDSAPRLPSAGTDDGSDNEEEGDRIWSSMSLSLLADLLAIPPGSIDALWVDDRWVNQHRLAGTTRIVDVLEVLAALEASGGLAQSRRWALHMRLRAGNVQIIPLTKEELLYYLRAAPIIEGEVFETRPLRILRQYVAGLLAHAPSLRLPTREQLAEEVVADLEVLRSYAAAIRGSLLHVWCDVGEPVDKSALAIAEARSRWLVNNLYVDLGLFRAHVVHPDSPPEPSVSAIDAATLFGSGLQLLSERDALDDNQKDVLAAAYVRWVDQHIVAERAARDTVYRKAVVKHLQRILGEWPSRDSKESVALMVSRHLAGRLYDALPEAWRAAVSEDSALMDFLGRAVVPSITIGPWNVSPDEFAKAVAAAMVAGVERVPILGADPPVMLMLSSPDGASLVLTPPDGNEPAIIDDPTFRVLSPDESVRRSAYDATRHLADVGATAWKEITGPLISLDDPVPGFITVLDHIQSSLPLRYESMRVRWSTERRLETEDLQAPDARSVLNHLRIPYAKASTADWDRAADTLIADDGLETALERLTGVPVPIPTPILSALQSMESDTRRTLLRRVFRRSRSPVGIVNLLRVLAVLGESEPRYHRWARVLITRMTTPSWQAEIRLLRAVVAAALAPRNDTLNSPDKSNSKGDSASGAPPTGQLPPTEVATGSENPSLLQDALADGLLTSWYHAHQFVSATTGIGVGAEAMLAHVKERQSGRVDELFSDVGVSLPDIAQPTAISTKRFLIAGLQYASTNTQTLVRLSGLQGALQSAVMREGASGDVAHIDLLRDVSTYTNVLRTWLPPERRPDGSIEVGQLVVVPQSLAPSMLRAESLAALTTNPIALEGWAGLTITLGPHSLAGSEAEEFDDATSAQDIPELLRELGEHARFAAERLARQALASYNVSHRQRLREALLATVREDRSDRGSQNSSHDNDDLSALQLAVLEGLYLLAQAETGAMERMATFARDLSALGRMDVAYLRRSRHVIEQLIRERPLAEAHALTTLLAEVRSV